MVGAGASWRSAIKLYTYIHTGKCTQQTIGITGGATILRMGYQTMLRGERAENFWVSTSNCDIFEVHQSQIKSKKLWNIFVLKAKRQFVSPPSQMLANSAGQTTLWSPTRNSGESSPVIYATAYTGVKETDQRLRYVSIASTFPVYCTNICQQF